MNNVGNETLYKGCLDLKTNSEHILHTKQGWANNSKAWLVATLALGLFRDLELNFPTDHRTPSQNEF